MEKDMHALSNKDTWELVNLTLRKDVIGCQWVFSIKYHLDGTIE